ncbi:MAG TPA: ribbon-helix-helix protein, CopG family [Gammaproteobacteria bacterium]|nr:ribbon-helix-helix protein, CopG family [Gammaproteobacteria bacterium]
MNTLTIRIPDQLAKEMEQVLARDHLTKSELVRRALAAYLLQHRQGGQPFSSALEQAGDLVGCFDGGPEDLSHNPEHLFDLGRA